MTWNAADRNEVIEDGLDRQNLTQLRQRFLTINNDRLARLRDALSERQQLFVNVLPLLFHTNHPMMPGYISGTTPAGVSNYRPDSNDIKLGRAIARSFTHSLNTANEDIYGIYIMGSVGTIAQSNNSDLDIWLCYRPGLPPSSICELSAKCRSIAAWAAERKLEVHFFLMNCEEFRQGKLSELNNESSGSAQRVLLLDEFYRTAIFLAGRMPLWWFVPTSCEQGYAERSDTLLTNKYIQSDSVLDFGGITSIPDGEFIGAGIWQLYKAIESPYKSVLKLLLLEAYASEHPHIQPLSLTFKRNVFEGKIDIDELDSYMMIYRRIESYLMGKQQVKRLELARRCFYFKANKPLSKASTSPHKSWQRVLLEKLTAEWGWTHDYIAMLDKRSQWKVPEVAIERSILVNELNLGYRFLQEFASSTRANLSISAEELTILGRKLQAAFERRPGKIEWLNPGISNNLAESTISISQVYDDNSKSHVWTAFSHGDPGQIQAGVAIKSSSSIVELLLWNYYNGVIDLNTQFELPPDTPINIFELKKILSMFQQWLPSSRSAMQHNHFKKTAVPLEVLMLVNVGKQPMPHLHDQGVQRLSARADAFRYSGFEENLVVSIDVITRNSWNEINTRRFDKNAVLLDALNEYLQLCLPSTHQAPPKLTIECIGGSYANTITQRLTTWFNEITECYYSGKYPPATRYLFEMDNDFYCLQFKGMRLKTERFHSEKALIEHLGKEQAKESPIVIDSHALQRHPLKAIVNHCGHDAINVFYRGFDIGMEIYVMDEKGSLIRTVFRGNTEYSPLKHLHRFLRAVVNRQAQFNDAMAGDFGIYPINFFEIQVDTQKRYHCVEKKVPTDRRVQALFDFKAVAHSDMNGKICFDYYCDDQEFSGISFGEQLELVVAQFVLSCRQSGERYPIHITDLDLSLCAKELAEDGNLQTSHYLKAKSRLEAKLNHAIGILAKD